MKKKPSKLHAWGQGPRAAFVKKKLSKRPLEHGWYTSNATCNTLVRLAYDNIAGPNIANPYRYDADCVFVGISSTNAGH